MKRASYWLTLVAGAAGILIISPLAGAGPVEGAAAANQAAAAWSSLPPQQWPQLVLTNNASFDGRTPLEGASAFLMRMPDGQVLLGTAKHLIGAAGGVKPPIPLSDLDHVLKQWKVFPRTKSDLAIGAGGLAITANRPVTHDWLLLKLLDAHAKLPSTPLTPRLKPIGVGEKVYLVGVPYSDTDSAQNVYTGIVTARPRKNYFTYEFTPPVHIPGFSGAPIVDGHGLLVGHGVSMGSELKQKDGMEVEFGGEDASLAVALWEHRNDPPPVDPASVIRMELPPGWIAKTAKSGKVIKFAENPGLIAFFEVVGEPKAEFDSDVDLMAWARMVKTNRTKVSTLQDRQETGLKPGNIGGHPTLEYEISGHLKYAYRFRVTMLELNGCYCEVTCWTTPSHWEAAQPEFRQLVETMEKSSGLTRAGGS